MFILTFWVDGVPQPVAMRYTDREKALKVYSGFIESAAGTTSEMTDDFDSRASLPRSRTLVSIFTDITKDVEAQIEISVQQQRANASLQSRLQSDPVIGLHNNRPSGLVRAS